MKKLLYGLVAIFTTAVLVLFQSQSGLTQSSRAVAEIARQITVKVDVGAPGSGVIVGKNGSTYYVLTAKHVVEDDATGGFSIVTPDQSSYPGQNYRELPGGRNVDLAVVEFNSNQNYTAANLGDSDQVDQGTPVWVAGFPNPGQVVTTRELNIVPGEIRTRLLQPTEKGYTLSYTNPTEAGMSGGPVLDQNGLLVGIHGQGESVAKNFAIPINTFTRVVSQMNISIARSGAPAISPVVNPNDLASNCRKLKADYKYWQEKQRELRRACFFNKDSATCSEEKAAAEKVRQATSQWTQLGCEGQIWSIL